MTGVDQLLGSIPLSDKKPVAANWRIEITHRGRYYQYRRFSGKMREYMPGGKTNALPLERMEQYAKRTQKTGRAEKPAIITEFASRGMGE